VASERVSGYSGKRNYKDSLKISVIMVSSQDPRFPCKPLIKESPAWAVIF